MTQYYIMELQKYVDGSYGDIKHVTWDEDSTKARLKAESKFYEVLSAAAVSELPVHAIPQPEPETPEEDIPVEGE